MEETKLNVVVIGADFGGLEFIKTLEFDLDKINLYLIEKNQSWTPRNSLKHLLTGVKDLQVLSENMGNLKFKKLTHLSDEAVKEELKYFFFFQ